jgi:bifunctional non-homologous end joining protein LigD
MPDKVMPDKLAEYHAKRDFGITREPRGKVVKAGQQLRFVVQKHHARRLHYDFRLELDGTLKSWAVPKGPSFDPAEKRLAVHVEDHPLDYIDFEGSIPEHQYGAGTVEVWDNGYWQPHGDPAESYRAGKLKFELAGEKLHGNWTLVKTGLQGHGDKEQWLLIKEKDDAARSHEEFDVTVALPDSVKSGPQAKKQQAPVSDKTAAQPAPRRAKKSAAASLADLSGISDALKTPLPETLSLQLATLVDAVPRQGNWLYEIKYDGYRVLARADGKNVKLLTRNGKDWTAKLSRQGDAIAALGVQSAWLDGEIVVMNEHGIPSFQALQNAFNERRTGQIVFFVFDLPYLNGYDLRRVPLTERRRLLEQLMESSKDDTVRFSATLQEPPQKLLDGACELSLEGIIGKRAESIYTGQRSIDWIKLKCHKRQEFIIVGYTEPRGSRNFFGALLLGVYGEDGKLIYAGRVGTGFDDKTLREVYKQLEPLQQKDSHFGKLPSSVRRVSNAPIHWVEPKLVAEISFAEWTEEGLVRQGVFHGLRLDKPASEIKHEESAHTATVEKKLSAASSAKPAPANKAPMAKKDVPSQLAIVDEIKITHPERIIDASTGFTKLELVQYYDQVSAYLLPYLHRRPVYLIRAPEGIGGEQFFQKHGGRMVIPGVGTLDPSLDTEHQPLMVIETEHALVSAAQMGTIELHTCNATADQIDRPDMMIFDLDPDPLLPWSAVVEGAQLVKVVLDELGLHSFLKTSGGKGVHIVVPLARRQDWASVTDFSRSVAQHLAQTVPARFSAKMGAKNRVEKIYVDFQRNQKRASTVAPYSVRARPGLPVSAPISWQELKTVENAAMWNIKTLPQRLAQLDSDPWRDFFKTRQTLTKDMLSRF